jgi:hypothetical protein
MVIVWTTQGLNVLEFVHHCTRVFNYIHINSYNCTLNGSHVTILTKQTPINTKSRCRCLCYKDTSHITTLTTNMVSTIASSKLCNGRENSKLIVWLWFTCHHHITILSKFKLFATPIPLKHLITLWLSHFANLLNYQQLKEKEKCICKMIISWLSLECNAWGEIFFWSF